jgi:hypothetical protein
LPATTAELRLRFVFACEIDGGAATRGLRITFAAAALTSQIGTANATMASMTIKALFSLFVDAQRRSGALLVVAEVSRGSGLRINAPIKDQLEIFLMV